MLKCKEAARKDRLSADRQSRRLRAGGSSYVR